MLVGLTKERGVVRPMTTSGDLASNLQNTNIDTATAWMEMATRTELLRTPPDRAPPSVSVTFFPSERITHVFFSWVLVCSLSLSHRGNAKNRSKGVAEGSPDLMGCWDVSPNKKELAARSIEVRQLAQKRDCLVTPDGTQAGCRSLSTWMPLQFAATS